MFESTLFIITTSWIIFFEFICSLVKNLPANAGDTGDMGSIPGSGRAPGVGNGNSLQYSCLGNSMDREARWATVHGMAKNQTQLSK